MDQAMWVERASPPRILSRSTRRREHDERSRRDGREGCLVSSTRFSFLKLPLGLSPHLHLRTPYSYRTRRPGVNWCVLGTELAL